jgi:hypothetical protein
MDAPALSTGGLATTGGIPGSGGAISSDVIPTGGEVGTGGSITGTGGAHPDSAIDTAPLATIQSFTASPTLISVGKNSTLNWSVTGATTVTIDPDIGSVMGLTSKVVTPAQDTTYTLTVNGTVTAKATVTVIAMPVITSFIATPSAVNIGGTSSLSAVFTGGAGAVDHEIGTITSGTSKGTANVPNTTTYTLTVTNAAGDTQTATATVTAGKFTVTGSMTTARNGHKAILMKNGRVLIVGGYKDQVALKSAEIYDPGLGTFTATGDMDFIRTGCTATALNTGSVLIAGGYDEVNHLTLASAELYDPASGKFTSTTGTMTEPRKNATATVLSDGKVLIAGGNPGTTGVYDTASADLYDPAQDSFAATGAMTNSRMWAGSILLTSGVVLILGGARTVGNAGQWVLGVDVYDSLKGVFSPTTDLAHYWQADSPSDLLLSNGKVLLFDTSNDNLPILFDYVGKSSTETSMNTPIQVNGYSVTLLASGLILKAGGDSIISTLVNSAWLYDPERSAISNTSNLLVQRGGHSATMLAGGSVLIAGGMTVGGGLMTTRYSLSNAEIFR